MRLVIKDYLTLLKEKDELDLLLCDLLLQMGYLMDNKPETGNRQYGVDIRAYTETEALLCVVKQGKLNRENWDSGQNAVRQSLNEIHDVYLRFMSKEDREKQLRIAVITNNVMDEAVRPAWEGYVSENTNWSGIPVKLEFWGIDKLVADVQQYLFEEKLFGADKQKLLRRALYFIGEGDYRNEFFEQIIDGYLSELHAEDTPRQRDKKLAGLYLATQMIAQYAADTQIYKIAIMVTEYLIIRYWKFLLQNQLFEKKPYVEETIKELKRRGYQTAVVTATAEDRAVRSLEMVGFKELFDEIISASMVKLGKPRPDVYLYACDKIGRKPEECMAVEDSPNGVNAAYQAGCHVTMVPDLTPADEEVKKMADHVVPDLRGLLEYLR